ncbi:hypothetical protein [Neptuniibacter sp. QD37_11]|uniref:hypothetical protein n=1 Tax=Neptuniibacter sp. QD37_11 TaxID=3398209 RepID=UPI0039F523D2
MKTKKTLIAGLVAAAVMAGGMNTAVAADTGVKLYEYSSKQSERDMKKIDLEIEIMDEEINKIKSKNRVSELEKQIEEENAAHAAELDNMRAEHESQIQMMQIEFEEQIRSMMAAKEKENTHEPITKKEKIFVTEIMGEGKSRTAKIYHDYNILTVSAGDKVTDVIKVSNIGTNYITLYNTQTKKSEKINMTTRGYAVANSFPTAAPSVENMPENGNIYNNYQPSSSMPPMDPYMGQDMN